MPKHRQRMSKIGKYAIPPDGTFARKTFDDWMRNNPPPPSAKKEIKDRFKKAVARITAQFENGAGFQLDDLLRYFLQEYNDRNFNYGLRSLPSSFNILEAFHVYDPKYNFFRLRDEIDHLMSFVEFLDYFTSETPSEDTKDAIKYLDEGVIYSYNGINDPDEITFSIDNGSEFGVAGVSLVRYQSEINVFLIAGEKADLTAKSKEIKNIAGKPTPGKENLKPSDDRVREAVPLLNKSNFWKTIVLSRFDLEDMTQNARYILMDCGDSFMTITDDVEPFLDHATGNFLSSDFESIFKEVSNQIEQYKTVFEICKTALHLPMYFEHFGEYVVDERHSTKLFETIKKGRWITRKKLLGPKERITHRHVSVLRDVVLKHPSNTYYKAPPINIETTGYWRRLSVDQVGGDKLGNPIHGRTWVKKVLSWLQTDKDPGTIRAKCDKGVNENERKINQGYIYVMRSAAHDKDIFKIGLTRRSTDIRSEELSRTTGSPDKFLVVQEWEVSDCIEAEKVIHEKLSQYRINPNREFFKAPYKHIFSVIDSIIDQLESE